MTIDLPHPDPTRPGLAGVPLLAEDDAKQTRKGEQAKANPDFTFL